MINALNTKKASDTKLTLHRNGKIFQDFRLFLPAGQPTGLLDKNFIEEFNQALNLGVNNIDKVVEKFGKYRNNYRRDPSEISYRKY